MDRPANGGSPHRFPLDPLGPLGFPESSAKPLRPWGTPDTLFELVIDAQGKVEKVRLIRTHVHPDYQQDMLDHVSGLSFTPDAEGMGYRAFFYPVKYRYRSEFEWIDRG